MWLRHAACSRLGERESLRYHSYWLESDWYGAERMNIKKPSPALVIACTALFAASSGSAVAASLITGKQVKNSSLTGTDIKDKSLSAADFSGSVQGPAGAAGPAGPQGVPGANGLQGPAGPAGPAGLTSVAVVKGPVVPQGVSGSSTTVQSSKAECPTGTVVTGGGFDTGVRDFISTARPSGNGYFVIAINTGSITSSIQAYALCAAGPGATLTSARRDDQANATQREVEALTAARESEVGER